MKLGLGSYAFAWAIGVPGHPPLEPLGAFGFVERAAAHGFGLVQIADNLPLHTLSHAELRQLRALAQTLGVEVEVGTRGVTPENLERYLELACYFGSPILRVVADSAEHHPSLEEIARSIAEVLPRFAEADRTLALENHDRFRASELRDLVADLGSPYLGICLDTVNSFGALEGPEVVTETLAPHVVNLHVKDFRVAREAHNLGFRIFGTPAGQGMLDIPRLLRQLPAATCEMSAILELWPAPEAELPDTIAKEDRWVAESAAYLRPLLAQGSSGGAISD